SLERIDVFSTSTTPLNWSSSEDASGSTPGRVNSVAIADSDLALSIDDTLFASAVTPAVIPVLIRNRGRQQAAGFEVEFFDDSNHNGAGEANEFVGIVNGESPIASGDSVSIRFFWDDPAPGRHRVIAILQYDHDQRTSNNLALLTLGVGYPARSMVINEIMFDPLPGRAEYLEIMNMSAGPIELSGWTIADRPSGSGSKNTVRLGSSTMPPGELFVVASDSSLPELFPAIPSYEIVKSSLSLNNDGDDIVLRDQTGEVIDSVAYDPSWHNPDVRDTGGRSLERINPFIGSNDARNWSTCAIPLGGTPGLKNSLFSPTAHRATRFSFSPNPFSPDGDGFEDVVIIHYELQLTVSLMSVRIYDVRGRLIRRLANAEPAGPRGDLVWDGRDDERRVARIGMYVVFLEAIDERGGVLETVKGVVVLAARMK
ncbi:MAG: lamin tail domain-containing protein, partial [Ignavibacteria bacterium]|nr:lamin tail domain-containing protein [Ignavibacteria bacterium]